MRNKVIERHQAFAVAIALVPIEVIALLGFFNTPFDIGYPPGTSPWRIAIGLAGLYVHYPMAVALSYGIMDVWPRSVLMLVCFIIGWADLFLLSLVLVLIYRLATRLFSR